MVVLVLVGPSGAGKTTLQEALAEKLGDRATRAVSHTTRKRRPGEQDGREYHFVTEAKFQELAIAGAFVEHTTYAGNRYGSSESAVRAADHGVCVQVVDAAGCETYRELGTKGLDVKLAYVTAPRAKLIERLGLREQDGDTRIDGIDASLHHGGTHEFDVRVDTAKPLGECVAALDALVAPPKPIVVLAKPDACINGHHEFIKWRFAKKYGAPTREAAFTFKDPKLPALFEQHYAEHKGKDFYPGLIEAMSHGPVLAWQFMVNGDVAEARALCMELRKEYSRLPPPHNAVHTSDSAEAGVRESALWFDA